MYGTIKPDLSQIVFGLQSGNAGGVIVVGEKGVYEIVVGNARGK